MDLGALAASGASTVVGLMVTDSWAQVKARLARFFASDGAGADGAGDGDTGTGGAGVARSTGAPVADVEGELTSSREELVLALEEEDRAAADDVEAHWRRRLRATLRADPEAARRLEELLAELAAETGVGAHDSGGTVHNSISGGVVHGPVIQGRDMSGFTVRFDGAPPTVGGAGG